ncbi:hypothetical protein BDZ97DRAFT_632636 [Flammula alnicola]|nr:hypothetical protein BDZ97DRAFT_632636 [Flammula alnicola]
MSQQSNQSDEQQRALRDSLEKCLAAEVEKKKAHKEKKFLEVSAKYLNLDLETSAREVRDGMKAIDEVYTVFLMEYAGCEDRIHKKWVQLQEAEDNFVVRLKLAKERQRMDAKVIKTSASMHVSGLSKTRVACTAFRAIIDRLAPPEQDIANDE